MKEMGLFFTGMLALIVLSMAERKEREEELLKAKRETEKKEYKDFELLEGPAENPLNAEVI